MTLASISRIALLVAIGGGCLVSLGMMLQFGMDAGLLGLVATSALVATSLPLILGRLDDLYEPIWLVVLTVAIGVTGKAFYIYFGPRERVTFLLLDKQPRDLLFAALIMASGLLCLAVGYLLGNIRWKVPGLTRLTKNEWQLGRLAIVIGGLVAIGLLSFLALIQSLDVSLSNVSDLSSRRFISIPGSQYRGVHGYLHLGAKQIEIAFYLFFVTWAATKRKLNLAALAGVLLFALLAIAFPVFINTRQPILLMIIRVIIIWICIREQPKIRYVLPLVAAGLVLAGAMLAVRLRSSDWQAVRTHIGLSGLMEVTVGGRHFLDLTKTAHVLAAVPEVLDYQYGKTMVTWLMAPVPRSLWPEKPAIGVGIELGPLLFNTRATGVPPGIVGELYLNFGLPGVYIGLLAAGLLLRSLCSTLKPHFPNKSAVVIYTLLSTRLALDTLSHAVSGSVSLLLQELIPVIVAVYLCGGGKFGSALGK